MFQYSLISLLPVLGAALPALVPRADKTLEVPLTFGDRSWYVEVEIGSNKQKLKTSLDTGSSDAWFMSSSNPYCNNTQSSSAKRQYLSKRAYEYLSIYGEYIGGETVGNKSSLGLPVDKQFACNYIYDPSSSKTYNANDTEFMIAYYDTTYAYGTFATDDFYFGDTKISDVLFGLANVANISKPVFGIGAVGKETVANREEKNFTYSNFPKKLYDDGVISNYVYSIAVNSTEGVGSILFGGSDSSKYEGDLAVLDIIPTNGTVGDLYVNTSLSAHILNKSSIDLQTDVRSLVDTGTGAFTFTTESFSKFVRQFDNVTVNQNGKVFYPCEQLNNSKITVTLGDVDVDVYLKEWSTLLVDDYCVLDQYVSVSESYNQYVTLGLPFFDKVYSIFDYKKSQISFAKIKEGAVTNETTSSSTSTSSGSSSSSSSSSSGSSSSSSSSSGSNSDSKKNAGVKSVDISTMSFIATFAITGFVALFI